MFDDIKDEPYAMKSNLGMLYIDSPGTTPVWCIGTTRVFLEKDWNNGNPLMIIPDTTPFDEIVKIAERVGPEILKIPQIRCR